MVSSTVGSMKHYPFIFGGGPHPFRRYTVTAYAVALLACAILVALTNRPDPMNWFFMPIAVAGGVMAVTGLGLLVFHIAARVMFSVLLICIVAFGLFALSNNSDSVGPLALSLVAAAVLAGEFLSLSVDRTIATSRRWSHWPGSPG